MLLDDAVIMPGLVSRAFGSFEEAAAAKVIGV